LNWIESNILQVGWQNGIDWITYIGLDSYYNGIILLQYLPLLLATLQGRINQKSYPTERLWLDLSEPTAGPGNSRKFIAVSKNLVQLGFFALVHQQY